MLERLKTLPYQLSQGEQEELAWAEWAWQSHHWIETSSGYFQCKLCDTMFTNQMALRFDTVQLCKENPILKRDK